MNILWSRYTVRHVVKNAVSAEGQASPKYVSKIYVLNIEIVAVTEPCIRFFSFR